MRTQKNIMYVLVAFMLMLPTVIFSQRNLEKGNRLFDLNQYEKAIPFFEKDMKSSNKDVKKESMSKLADCYRLIGDFENAEKIYKKLIKKDKKGSGYVNLYKYGEALKAAAKYAEAKKIFQKYMKKMPDDPKGEMMYKSCDFAQEMLDAEPTHDVRELVEINTKEADISPVFYKNGMVFSAQRPGGIKPFVSFDGASEVLLDLYYMDFNGSEQSLSNKSYFFPGLNTNNHEGPASFSRDGKEVFYTTTVQGKRMSENDEVVKNTLQIFYAKLQGDTAWSTAKSVFNFNSQEYSVFHPSLSADGKKLFFASNMPGGKGGVDIYVSFKNSKGVWSEPYNLGPEVNTSENELFPFFDNRGNLYFSSNGHPGMGKLDIFVTRFDAFKGWVQVENMRMPINSIGDDICYVESESTGKGLFVSNRINGTGSDDIYAFSKIQPIQIQLDHKSVWIKNNSAYDALTFKFKKSGQKKSKPLEEKNGYFTFTPQMDTTYVIYARKEGFSNNKFTFKVSVNEDGNRVVDMKPKKGDVEFKVYAGEAKTYNDTIIDSLIAEPEKTGFMEKIKRLLQGKRTAVYSLSKLVEQEQVDIHSEMEIEEGIRVRHQINKKTLGVKMTEDDGSVSFIAKNKKNNHFVIISHPESIEEPEPMVVQEVKVEELKLSDLESKRAPVVIKGTVKDAAKTLEAVLVEIYSGDSVIASSKTDASGAFQFTLKEKSKYTVSVTKAGYFQKNTNIETKPTTDSKGVEEVAVALEQIVENKTISIPNIYYKSNSWKLSKKSIVELERLVVFMKENPQIKTLQIFSHTDNVGNDKYNMELSHKRAGSVQEFLTSKGVNASIISAKGMGESKLLIAEAQDEEDHSKNRRTEFKVVLK